MIRKSKSIAKEIDDKKRVITISFVLSWIFGALFLLSGVTSIFTKPLIGLMMLVMAAALLPPIVNKFENKFNIKITRNIKTFVLLACFFVIVVIGSIEGEIRQTKQEKIAKESIVPKSSPRNSHKTGTPSNTVLKELSPDTHSTSLKVVCNKFNVQATLKDSKLTFSLDTDLPDNTKVMVSVCRLYWKRESSEAYVINYYETKSTVGALRYLSMVKLDDERWSLDLQKKQTLLAKMGEPFEISRISDDVKLDMTVPINQDNPAFGNRNKNLVGPMVTDSGSLRVISVEKKFKAPLESIVLKSSPRNSHKRGTSSNIESSNEIHIKSKSNFSSLVGKKYIAPFSFEIINKYGTPKTLKGTNNNVWIAYFPKGNFTIIKDKKTNIINRVIPGKL